MAHPDETVMDRGGAFDFEGQYFQIQGAYAEPKPLQQPYPLIMNAGLSPAGRRFAAKHADLTFVAVPDLETGRTVVSEIKAMARKEFGRELFVFLMTYLVCAGNRTRSQRLRPLLRAQNGRRGSARPDLPSSAYAPFSKRLQGAMGGDGCQSHSGLSRLAARSGRLSESWKVCSGCPSRCGGITVFLRSGSESGLAQFGDQLLPLMLMRADLAPARFSSGMSRYQ